MLCVSGFQPQKGTAAVICCTLFEEVPEQRLYEWKLQRLVYYDAGILTNE